MTPSTLVKIVAFLMCVGSSGAQAATVAQSGAKLTLVSPLSLVKTGDLLFGNLVSGSTAGTVTIDPNTGTRTSSGGVMLLGGSAGPASFTGVAGGPSLVYIQQPATPVTLTRVGGTETMQVNSLSIQGGQFRLFLRRQAFNFNVGGTLSVGANQADGDYVGTFAVTINYF